MAEITLTYDGRNMAAKKMLEAILSLGLFKKKEKRMSGLDEALKEIKDGKVNRYSTVDEFVEKMKNV